MFAVSTGKTAAMKITSTDICYTNVEFREQGNPCALTIKNTENMKVR